MSLTIITSSGNSLSADFDRRFGRAAWFCAYNEETGESVFYENEYVHASHGAGTKVAERMMELKADKIISGDFGPKAKELLDRFKIQLVILQEPQLTVQEVIDKINHRNTN